MIHLAFYVPVNAAETVKQAMFAAGGGRIGNYSQCSFETKGVGQFLPHSGAHPSIGKINQLEKVEELKVEMVCEDQYLNAVIEALKSAHPYETPAYYAMKVLG